MHDDRCVVPTFGSPQEEIAYLKKRVSFLQDHAVSSLDKVLAGRIDKRSLEFQLRELQAMRDSLSWKLTRPLRVGNAFFKKVKNRVLAFKSGH